MTHSGDQDAQADSIEIQAIGIQIGSEEYGIRISEVQEVIPAPSITRVPNAPEYIVGVINLRGNVIPVVDLASRLGIGRTKINESTRIVAVDIKDEIVGVLAENVSKVSKLTSEDIKPPPPLVSGISGAFLDGVTKQGNRFLIFVNLARALKDEHENSNEGD